MTLDEMKELFEKYDDEFLKFEEVENKFNPRHDLHAFILLDLLDPNDDDIITNAEHDQIFLGVNVERLAEIITEEQILELTRCGVLFDEDDVSFSMFA